MAVGRAPAGFRRGGRSPLPYLETLQQADGSFRYSRSSAQTPVWVTAQVVAALRRKAFPVKEPARKRAQRAVKPGAAPKPSTRVVRERARRVEKARPAVAAIRRPVRTRLTSSPVAARKSDDAGLPLLIPIGAAVVAAGAAGAYLLQRRRT